MNLRVNQESVVYSERNMSYRICCSYDNTTSLGSPYIALHIVLLPAKTVIVLALELVLWYLHMICMHGFFTICQ